MKLNHPKLFSLAALTFLGALNFSTAHANEACKKFSAGFCPTPFDKALPPAQDMLTWNQDQRVIGFRNNYRSYKGDVFHKSVKPSLLPKAKYSLPKISYKLDDKQYDFNDYLQNQSVTGLLILKKGQIVKEFYGKGNTPKTLWTSRSVAKSIVGLLVGTAVKDGKIKSIQDLITDYLPELKGTAWDNVTVQQLMQHTSGVKWDENYADPKSNFAAMTKCESTNDPYNCVLNLVKSVERKPNVKPGEVWSYNTGGAWLVGLLLERATGLTIAKNLESKIWQPYGMETDGVWHALVEGKVDMGGHGFNATLRDWGRVGLFAAHNGILPNGKQALPANWMKESTTWTAAKGSPTDYAPNGQYGYQWWFNGVSPTNDKTDPKTTSTSNQTYWAFGIYGQTIAINPAEDLVVVQWSTWKQAEKPVSLYDEQMVFVNALSNALADK